MNETLVALVVPVASIAGVVLALFLALHFKQRARELRHRERMAAIDKGIELPPEPVTGPGIYLLRGLVWLFTGIAVVMFFLAMFAAEGDKELVAVSVLGLIPVGVGAAYLIVYRKSLASDSMSTVSTSGAVREGGPVS